MEEFWHISPNLVHTDKSMLSSKEAVRSVLLHKQADKRSFWGKLAGTRSFGVSWCLATPGGHLPELLHPQVHTTSSVIELHFQQERCL